MEILNDIWDLASALVLVTFGAILAFRLGRYFSSSSRRALLIYFWHTCFCVVYLLYILNDGGDALAYYRASLNSEVSFSFGTDAVVYFTSILSSEIGFSLLGAFLVFNIIGYMGLLAVDGSLRKVTRRKTKHVRLLASIIVFLPSASFWSSAIGKDAIAFLSVGLALWASQNHRQQSVWMITAIVIMLLVRPHIAALMTLAFLFSVLINAHMSIFNKVTGGVVTLALAIAVVPTGLYYSGLDPAEGVAGAVEYAELRQSYNLHGGGGIDISNMSLTMKLFTYLFRPLPFEAHNIPALAASLDNTLLLFIAVAGIWGIIKRGGNSLVNRAGFLWLYSLSTWLALSVTTANLGISVRQKWMFLPMLFLLFVGSIGKSRSRPGIRAEQGETAMESIDRPVPQLVTND